MSDPFPVSLQQIHNDTCVYSYVDIKPRVNVKLRNVYRSALLTGRGHGVEDFDS